MGKNNKWFDWYNPNDLKQRTWAFKYISRRDGSVSTEMGLTQWINQTNANLNSNPENLALKKLRNNMWQAWKQESKRKASGKKSCNFILSTQTDDQLKRIASLHNLPIHKTLEGLINDAALKTNEILDGIKKILKERKLNKTSIARVKKTIESIEITSLNNTVRNLELKNKFLTDKMDSLIHREIRNRYLIDKHQITSDTLTDDESKQIREQYQTAIKNLDEELQDELKLKFLNKLPD